MSAPSESTTSPSPCACTNISLMQLFHELKQKFPGVPDHVVSNTIELYCHDKQACETHLHREVKASLTHAYHASSSAAARQLSELRIKAPTKCRNQPIIKHEAPKSAVAKSVVCQSPQSAVINEIVKEKISTDANQNVVEAEIADEESINQITSPVTIINIDNCYAKYSAESPSDLELTNENVNTVDENIAVDSKLKGFENTNYKILKSNKIKSNLNQCLESNKLNEKKTIKKDNPRPELSKEKPKRPNTLDFIKSYPDIAFKQTLNPPQETEDSRSISPAPKPAIQSMKENNPSGTYHPDRGYPLNLSVNVNCHMDLGPTYRDPWLEDYESPRTITSVNLTVCTPTSNMSSPVREARDKREEDGGFEGHVTVTVSPSTTRGPRRPAPPPPPQPSSLVTDTRPKRVAPDPPEQANEGSLIERQKERRGRLARALAQERARLAQLTRETQILAAPTPNPTATQRLKDYVERLRDQCDSLSKKLEMVSSEKEESSNFYSNIYTGQRPPASWQCHMCTFRNHPLLDKCEECDMPRILVGTSLTRTHDSGFGSLRDRTRNASSEADVDDITDSDTYISNIVADRCTLPRLNC